MAFKQSTIANEFKRFEHSARWLLGIVVIAAMASGACSTHRKSSGAKSSAPSEANNAPGKPSNFSWELADLPACYDQRDGAEVYVWRTQKTMKCDKTTGKWSAGGAS